MSLPSVCASPNAGVRIWGLLWRAEVVSSADVARPCGFLCWLQALWAIAGNGYSYTGGLPGDAACTIAITLVIF